MPKTLAEEMREEAERLRRRFVEFTRPKRPLTMDEARRLHKAIESPIASPTQSPKL
jgi:hypothetical protein